MILYLLDSNILLRLFHRTHAVIGVQVHDTRISAAMQVHGVTHLLTFNGGDFARFPGVTSQHPRDI